jgi:hypothetical protein
MSMTTQFLKVTKEQRKADHTSQGQLTWQRKQPGSPQAVTWSKAVEGRLAMLLQGDVQSESYEHPRPIAQAHLSFLSVLASSAFASIAILS